MRKLCRTLTVSIFAAVLTAGTLTFADADARSIIYDLNIPSEDLTAALQSFAIASHHKLLYKAELTAGKISRALKGQFTAVEAMEALLSGTGLSYEITGSSVVLIKDQSGAKTSELREEGNAPSPPRAEPQSSGGQPMLLAQVNQGKTTSDVPVNKSNDETKDKKTEGLEEIIVTGTHIHNVAPISPVLTITHDDIVREGYTTVAEIVEQLPQNFLGAGASPGSSIISSFGSSAAGNNLTFASSINLRGLGASATLVLLNGRRMAPQAFAGTADISNIPVNMIDRIEIVTDGASSVYGADAVAGVVNIITRREFSGVQVDAGLTGISDGKTPDHNVGLLTGTSWNGGSLVASADYEKDNPLYARNRYFTQGLADPWELTPKNEKMNLYVSAHQDFSDALTLSGDAFVARRNFDVSAASYAQYGFALPFTYTGRANQYNASLQLDYRISPDWTVALIGQISKEQDPADTYDPNFGDAQAQNGSYRVASLESRIDGKLFELPGGSVRTAIGAQFLQERFEEVFSAGTLSDPSANGPTEQFDQSRHVSSAYGELSIPLIGKDNGVPLVRGFRINVSARYDSYSDFGHTSNPRFALEWEPAEDVKVHATYSRSFQVPQFFQLATPRVADVLPLQDPNSATGSTVGVETSGGTSNLQPETAKSLNLGLTYEPQSVNGLKIDASYFSVKFDHQIIAIADLGFNASNFLPQATTLGPSLVQLNPSLAQVTQALAVPQVYNSIGAANGCLIGSPGCPTVDPASVKALVDGSYVNSAINNVAGEDIDVRYKMPETRIGNFLIDVDATYYNKYEFRLSNTAPGTSFLNTTINPLRFRAKANFGWSQNAWGANARVNFSNKYSNTIDTNCAATNSCSVSSWTTVDLNGFYAPLTRMGPKWLEDSRVTFIVSNLFNRAPPSVTYPPIYPQQGYDPSNANPLLRTFGVTFMKRFGRNGDR
jgi:iron complex outermembrane receptor protein